jgi:hypothetical protein
LSRDLPGKDVANDSKKQYNDPPGEMGGSSYGKGQVWRRKETSAAAPQNNTPLAQAGANTPEPAARLTDLNEIRSPTVVLQHTPTHIMADSIEEEAPQQQDPRKVNIKIPTAMWDELQSECGTKALVSLLGHIQGKHPGLKALTAWAQKTLHPSFALLSLQANNIFEITFDKPEGRIHALNQADLVCESAAIFLSSWQPHFDAKETQESGSLDHPVWMQVANLCQVLRNEAFLRNIGEQIGQVISIDNSEAYRAKLFGPRVRLLVKDLDNLPHTVVIPRLDGKGSKEYALEFSGLPNQCGRCRSREHQVRFCPRKEFTGRQQRVTGRRIEQTRPPMHTTPNCTSNPPPTRTSDLEQPGTAEESQAKETSPQPEQPETSKAGEESYSPKAEDRGDTCTADPRHKPITAQPTEQDEAAEASTLHPDEVNFPKLPSPKRKADQRETPEPTPTTPPPTQFVWCNTPATHKEGEKGKQVTKAPDSAPITRQGYRSGRLTEDFWVALQTPNTPTSQRKTLRVIPLLFKEGKEEAMDYLINTKVAASKSIAQVHIAELLAGVPWTETRARQHVVSEVAQALYKVLVFTNPSLNPLQRWKQGRWFANWEGELEGDHTCTLFVTVPVQESKIKPRRGQACSWSKIPNEIKNRIQLHTSEEIEAITEDRTHWFQMIYPEAPDTNSTPKTKATHQNRFAVLSEENTHTM